MKAKKCGSLLLAGVFALLTCGAATAGTRYVAEYKGASSKAVKAVKKAGGTIVADLSAIKTLVVESDVANFASEAAASRSLSAVVQDQEVQWIPDVRVAGDAIETLAAPPAGQGNPNLALFLSFQWSIPITQTDLAWAITQGSPEVKVAVLDSGVCSHHIDLAGKIDAANSVSFVSEPAVCSLGSLVVPFTPCPTCPDWEDYRFHGTHVAGIISTNNLGTAGIAPNVTLRAVKVLNCSGSGSFSNIIQGLVFAADTGNDIINMSLGAIFPKNLPGGGQLVAALNKAVNYANSKGVLVVSASGNSGIDLDHAGNVTTVPCESGSGMCIGSTTDIDALSTFSNHGVSAVNIVAPGGGDPSVRSAPLNWILAPCSAHSVFFGCGIGSFLWAAGTSMAAPHVSGAAALVESVAKKGPGTAKPSQVRSALQQSADDLGDPGADNIFSKGRLNTYSAVQ